MQRVDRDSVGRRAGRLRERRSELLMRCVADADPIDGTQYDRFVFANEHDPACRERRLDLDVSVIRHCAPNGRRGIDVEKTHAQRLSAAGACVGRAKLLLSLKDERAKFLLSRNIGLDGRQCKQKQAEDGCQAKHRCQPLVAGSQWSAADRKRRSRNKISRHALVSGYGLLSWFPGFLIAHGTNGSRGAADSRGAIQSECARGREPELFNSRTDGSCSP